MSVGISHHFYFKQDKQVFCPNGFSSETKRIIDNAITCDNLRNSALYHDCMHYKNCIQCPKHGHCVNGELHCDDTYVKKGTNCVEDEILSRYALELLDHFQDEL